VPKKEVDVLFDTPTDIISKQLQDNNRKKINKMVWFLILAAVLAAFVYRIIACIRKSKQSGEEWNLADKYAANDFGE
jgi:phosphoglycerol transferase MdoB-like AlkP superfamily enzyme